MIIGCFVSLLILFGIPLLFKLFGPTLPDDGTAGAIFFIWSLIMVFPSCIIADEIIKFNKTKTNGF